MKETAKFIGNLSWFSASKTRGRYSSPREALKAHLDYITRPSECVVSWNLKKEEWLRRADYLLSENARSRIASKIVFALPNDLSAQEGLTLLKEFLTSQEIFFYKVREDGKTKRVPVRLGVEDFGVAVHDSKGVSGERNLHAHVLFSPVWKGRKLDANKSSLSRLHREWESFLKSKGYHLRKSPIKEPHYGPQRLRFDSRARASYRHLSTAKRLWRSALERERMARMLGQVVRAQPVEGLTWDEILEETPAREERKFQGRSSPKLVQKPVQEPVQQIRIQMSSILSPPTEAYVTAELVSVPRSKEERELLKLLSELEREVARKQREEEVRQKREAMMLEEQLKRVVVIPAPDDDDDWDRGPGM